MMTVIKIEFDDVERVVKRLGLAPGGDVQRFFTNELMRISGPYTPHSEVGLLQALAHMTADGTGILYLVPYARYHWYGKLMVDPTTGKGAFFNSEYGFWSRPGVQKVLTDKDMQYQGAPLRGPHWVERAYIDNKTAVITSTERYLKDRR